MSPMRGKTMKRKLLFVISGIIVITAGIGFYLYSKPNKDLERARADFRIEASDLFEEFSTDESLATEKYVDKVLEITGSLAGIQTGTRGNTILFLLDDLFGISCSMDSSYAASVKTELDQLNIGDSITIRGRCNGMLIDIQLSGCVLLGD